MQGSEWQWQWADGSSADVAWRLDHLYPDYAVNLHYGNYCPHCNATLVQGAAKRNDTPHCSAFMISPDFAQIGIIPVDCTTKYFTWTLCVDKSNNTVHQAPKDANVGKGEYKISWNALARLNYMCPIDYNIVIHGMYLRVTLMQDKILKLNGTYNLKNLYNHNICRNSKSYAEVSSDVDIDISVIHEVMDEFYAQGSEMFLNHEIIDPDGYVWFTPSLYSTYVPCFTDRVQVANEMITNNVEVFSCEDGSVIPNVLLCNGKADCTNSVDESHCVTCSDHSYGTCFNNCTFPNCHCNMFYYQCKRGGCVHYDHICDSFVDCLDGDDEHGCYQKKTFYNFDEAYIKKSLFVGLCDPPTGDILMCRSVAQCYNSTAICHYDHSGGAMAYCEDGSHLGTGSLCQYVECPQHYKCYSSYCIPSRKLCDGVIDCPTGDDEASCVDFKCPGHMRCSGVSFCVPPHEVCDGIAHCPRQDDEKYCQTCPQDCNCKGTAVYCQQINNLALTGDLLSPSALILYNSFEVFIDLYDLYWANMQHVWLVDLKNGSFASLLFNKTLPSQGFMSVKILYLNLQDLRKIPSHFINGENMIYVNLSYNIIHTLNRNAFALMQNVKILSLAHNKLRTLESHFYPDLKFLSHLYLSDNQLISVMANIFQENFGLVLVRSDWYMVCCVVVEVEDCHPQNEFVSSCSHLITSVLQKTVLIVQGIVVIISNVGALVIQFTLDHCKMAEKYLIVSLAIADLMMGFYLLAIVSVDFTYSATFHKIISEWTSGLACILFGLINFISSEVALTILSLMSFVRVISIDKVGGMRFMKAKIGLAGICIWFVIMTTGIFYALYIFTNSMGLRNNMCIFFWCISSEVDHTI